MSLSETDRELIEAFRCYIEDSIASDDRYGSVSRHDSEDQSTLATRFEAGPHCWFEVALRPMVPQIRVAFVTDDRWKSEEIEQAIQDSGDTMQEFVGLGFTDAGLDWESPPVEHYREDQTLYFFTTPLEVEDLVDIDTEDLRNKTLRMLEGTLVAFGPSVWLEEED